MWLYYYPDNHMCVSTLAYLSNIVFSHRARNITFVFEDKQACSQQTLHISADIDLVFSTTNLFLQQTCKFISTIGYSFAISCINDPDECVGLFEIVLPICTQCLLASDVPCKVSTCMLFMF